MKNKNVIIKKSKIDGANKGLFANQYFEKNQLIGQAHENGQPVGNIGHMHNHSDNPNMYSIKKGNKRFVFAKNNIQAGEELTTNYRLQPELEQPEDFREKNKTLKKQKNFRKKGGESNVKFISSKDGVETPIYKQVEIKPSKIHGKGLFTKELIKKNEPIGICHVKNKDGQLIPSTILGMYNHNKKTPNVYEINKGDHVVLMPLRNINPGEELTADYDMVPIEGLQDSSSFQDGGNSDAMNGMMKARLAYANEFKNPAAKRMINLPDNPYQFDNGDTGTHYMASYDNYAVPQIQDENGVLQLRDYGPESNEAIRFDSDEDANYFAENYKDVSPGFLNQKQNGGVINKFEGDGKTLSSVVNIDSTIINDISNAKTFNEAFKIARNAYGANHIFEWKDRKYGTNLVGEDFKPSEDVLAKAGLNTPSIKKNLNKQNSELNDPYVSKSTVKLEPDTYKSWNEIKQKNLELNMSANADKIINYKNNIRGDKNYIIVDKKKGLMHIYQPGNNTPLFTSPVDLGASIGDAQTVTKIKDTNGDGKIDTQEAQIGKADFDKGNKSTGAGKYYISNIDPKGYGGLPLFNMMNESQYQNFLKTGNVDNVATSFHKGFIPDDNSRVSNGCIRCNKTTLDNLTKYLQNSSEVYILPEDPNNKFVIENDKLNLKIKNKSPYYTYKNNGKVYKKENGAWYAAPKTGEQFIKIIQADRVKELNKNATNAGYNFYEDSKGNLQKGQGVNLGSTLNYIPIKAKLDKEKFVNDKFTYFDFSDNKELKVVNKFVSSLEQNKQKAMKAAKINGDVYNDIAQIAFGIFGTESNFADTHSAVGNLVRAIRKSNNPLSSSSPDYKSKYSTYGAKENFRSVGLTQIRWNYLSGDEKKALKSVGITSNADFMEPEKAALGTTIVLGVRYNQQLTDEEKKNIWNTLPKKWNKRKNYASRVLNNSKYLILEQKVTNKNSATKKDKWGRPSTSKWYGFNPQTKKYEFEIGGIIKSNSTKYFKNGGQKFIEVDLDEEEIEQYKKGGYVVEELDNYQDGGIYKVKGSSANYKKVNGKWQVDWNRSGKYQPLSKGDVKTRSANLDKYAKLVYTPEPKIDPYTKINSNVSDNTKVNNIYQKPLDWEFTPEARKLNKKDIVSYIKKDNEIENQRKIKQLEDSMPKTGMVNYEGIEETVGQYNRRKEKYDDLNFLQKMIESDPADNYKIQPVGDSPFMDTPMTGIGGAPKIILKAGKWLKPLWTGSKNATQPFRQATVSGFKAPLPLGKTITNATAGKLNLGNTLGAYFGAEGIHNQFNPNSDVVRSQGNFVKNPSWNSFADAAFETGVNSLNFLGLDLGKQVIKPGINKIKDLGKFINPTNVSKSVLTNYKNIDELRLANLIKNYNELGGRPFNLSMFPNKQVFNQTKKESNKLLKKYKGAFEKRFGKGNDNEVLLYGAYKDLIHLPNQNFLIDDAFAKSHGLRNNLSNQDKFLTDAYQLEFSNYFNKRPMSYSGMNKRFSEYLANKFENVITANKVNSPVQVKRRSSFDRPIMTNREGVSEPFMSEYDELIEGDIIYPEHNWSTSSNITGNVWGSSQPESKVARINLPAGQSVLRPNMYKGSLFKTEDEIVLPSKLGYTVKKINPQGFTDLDPRFIFEINNPYKKGGYIDLELTPEEIEQYRRGGYVVEELY